MGIDEDMRPMWSEVIYNLALYSTCDTPEALGVLDQKDGLLTLAQAIGPTYKERGSYGPESPRLRPMEELRS